MVSKKDWFVDWFNTELYHTLYQHRDTEEAAFFLNNLSQYLRLSNNENVLDICCGRGRHSVYLNLKGFYVEGFDLSPSNIQYAKKFENPRLKFYEHDMRNEFKSNFFDLALNLFSSFGYFDDNADNFKVVKNAGKNLKKDGVLVIDFMNGHKVLNNLNLFEDKYTGGYHFRIEKTIESGFIVKKISVIENDIEKQFVEKVKILTKENFEDYFLEAGFEIFKIAGNYSLNDFDKEKSDRMIVFGRKI